MINSITKKLTILFVSAILLVGFIAFSIGNLWYEQNTTFVELQRITEIQRDVDGLRSQLWVFLQYDDQKSLEQVYKAQKKLDATLKSPVDVTFRVDKLIKMNNSLATLLTQERTMVARDKRFVTSSLTRFVGTSELLHSRYNMIVQNMTEELIYLQQMVLEKSNKNQSFSVVSALIQQVILGVIVCSLAFMILRRFKHGFTLMKQGISDLAKGDLDSRLSHHNLDSEFVTLAKFFNQMKVSLQNTTYSKEELQSEVERQTYKLQKQKERLRFLSEKDALSGLYNRRALKDNLNKAIIQARRTHLKLAVLFIDLDKFKHVNDNFGHDAGDKVIVTIAERLNANLRESDFCGRFGGDEFIVCLDLLNDYQGVKEKALQLIDELTQPIELKDGSVTRVGASIGISLYPLQGNDAVQLIKAADQAMYQAKSKRDGSYCCALMDEIEQAQLG
ncbi:MULTISPECIES: GGDEF domain-containing protein [Vibrio]|uniref:Diguanylate cyclase n=2 Tax=Vibrio TaxID=662 RepID=A0A7X4LNV9_9VIBR|nr:MULTISPECIES: GGDEF domain-containing protein [Vibrio]MBF9000422.1 diguanylate cyclase [Vibrio nitrifigilis]MZI95413.1 diguanylate cyclase [Vibrio eleionomae]